MLGLFRLLRFLLISWLIRFRFFRLLLLFRLLGCPLLEDYFRSFEVYFVEEAEEVELTPVNLASSPSHTSLLDLAD
jgi:hypothetical protein